MDDGGGGEDEFKGLAPAFSRNRVEASSRRDAIWPSDRSSSSSSLASSMLSVCSRGLCLWVGGGIDVASVEAG